MLIVEWLVFTSRREIEVERLGSPLDPQGVNWTMIFYHFQSISLLLPCKFVPDSLCWIYELNFWAFVYVYNMSRQQKIPQIAVQPAAFIRNLVWNAFLEYPFYFKRQTSEVYLFCLRVLSYFMQVFRPRLYFCFCFRFVLRNIRWLLG